MHFPIFGCEFFIRISSPELHELFLRGRKTLDELGDIEYLRFSDLCLKAFWYFSAVHIQLRSGMLTEEEWHETRAVVHYFVRGPGVRAWWEKTGRQMFGSGFAGFVEEEIAKVSTVRDQL